MIIALWFLFGLFRLAIYLTPEAAGDETTHYRPGDCIWSLLRGICLGLHGYNPLVWWAAILSRNDAELACDEAAIKRIGEIEMTCQGHPALLLTATAMTGSKSSMKECITLIVKKPKTAIYTLVTVLLIAAVAAGCALAGTAGDKDKPWTWMQNLVSEDITSATAWYGYSVEGSRLSDSDTVALISLLNAVGKTNFTENKQAAGATPQYGLAFDCGGASYYINEAVSPSGSLEMSYGGKQWWIDSAALQAFIAALAINGLENNTDTAKINRQIIDLLNSDGAYTTSALDALTDSLMSNSADIFAAIGTRSEGIQDWICWSLANYMNGMALDTGDALTMDGLSGSADFAQELLWKYMSGDYEAPKHWRQIYMDFWDETVPSLTEDEEIFAIGLFDTQADGVPELTIWYTESTDGVLYYNDGVSIYHDVGSIYEGTPPMDSADVLCVQDGDMIDHETVNALLNSWRSTT